MADAHERFGSWEAIARHPMFTSAVDQVQHALDAMIEERRPVTVLVVRSTPGDADRVPDRLLEGYREQSHTVIANCLRLLGREADRCARPFSVVIGSLCYIALPGCDLRKCDRDLSEILDSVARAPWTHPRGIVPRRLHIGVATWEPTMASSSARILLGRAFEALVMASFGMTESWPSALPVHPHDQANLAVHAWNPPRRRQATPLPGKAPVPASSASRCPAGTRSLRREKPRAAKVAPRPWWKIW
ncbi:MAG: hypothetical protein VKP72_14455 [bacterium]|nr:hypothetical protein [bacterium]